MATVLPPALKAVSACENHVCHVNYNDESPRVRPEANTELLPVTGWTVYPCPLARAQLYISDRRRVALHLTTTTDCAAGAPVSKSPSAHATLNTHSGSSNHGARKLCVLANQHPDHRHKHGSKTRGGRGYGPPRPSPHRWPRAASQSLRSVGSSGHAGLAVRVAASIRALGTGAQLCSRLVEAGAPHVAAAVPGSRLGRVARRGAYSAQAVGTRGVGPAAHCDVLQPGRDQPREGSVRARLGGASGRAASGGGVARRLCCWQSVCRTTVLQLLDLIWDLLLVPRPTVLWTHTTTGVTHW